MNTINQLAARYRKMSAHVKRADAKIQKAKTHMQQLNQDRNQLVQELEQMRVILDYCVVTGESPVQAQLSHTLEQMQTKIQDHRRRLRMDVLYYTPSGSSVAVSTTGLNTMISKAHTGSGATGAIGAPYVIPFTSPISVSSLSSTYQINDEIDLTNLNIS